MAHKRTGRPRRHTGSARQGCTSQHTPTLSRSLQAIREGLTDAGLPSRPNGARRLAALTPTGAPLLVELHRDARRRGWILALEAPAVTWKGAVALPLAAGEVRRCVRRVTSALLSLWAREALT